MLRAPLFIAVVWVTSLASTAYADDLATLRGRVVDSYTAASSPAGDPGIVAAQKSITNSAASILKTAAVDGSFPDLPYTDTPTATWSVGTHFGRVLTLAQAYAIPGGTLYHDATLKDAIVRALTYGSTAYCGDASCTVGNWWFWEIGVPNSLGPTLVLMQSDLDAALFSKLLEALRFHVGTVAHMQTFTGENLLWCAFNHLRIALLDNDATELEPVKAAVETTCAVNALALGDGIKPDHSFQQHGGLLYTGGYGAGYAADIASYLQLTDGTAFAPSDSAKQSAIDYVTDGTRWAVYGAYYDVEVIGREVSRPGGGSASTARNALVKLSFVTSTRQNELRSGAKALVAALGSGGIDVVALSEKFATLADPPAALPRGFRHFESSDHSVYRQDGYYASIKAFSKRTKSGELVNTEGKLGSRQSDGRLYLVRKGDEYFGKKLWPALDWARLPGITVEQSASAANQTFGVGTTDFVGGTGDGTSGVAAMDLAPLGSTLRAKKSWFFVNDTIIFLGSGVSATSPAPVETIVEQWPLSSPTAAVNADGKLLAADVFSGTAPRVNAITADGLGYYFPGGADVNVDIKDQSGDWSNLGVSSGQVTGRFLTLSLQHGVAPVGAHYVYAIALNGQDILGWASTPPFTVVKNEETQAIVRAGSHLGVVFFAPGTVDMGGATLEADTACVAWLTDDGTVITVSSSDPAQGSGSMKLTIGGSYADATPDDSGVTIQNDADKVVATVARAGGATHSFRLSRIGILPSLDAGTRVDGGTGTVADAAASGANRTNTQGKCGCRIVGARAPHASGLAFSLLALLMATRRRSKH